MQPQQQQKKAHQAQALAQQVQGVDQHVAKAVSIAVEYLFRPLAQIQILLALQALIVRVGHMAIHLLHEAVGQAQPGLEGLVLA